MSISPIAYSESLRIGTVDFASPDEIKVLLEIEAPDSMALNTGVPHSFPQVNGYVLIPNEVGYLVGQIEWITIERSQYPKRKGMQDFGLVDLPYPLRRMSVNPLGTLIPDRDLASTGNGYTFGRGTHAFPTVGDPVLLPTQTQLRAIVESGKNKYVKIGTSPLAAHAEVRIDPDRMFGRHLAVLGNTGSGKSCSVAGLIRWSLEEARKESSKSHPNARFIVLDPNGEYHRAFHDMDDVRIYAVESEREGTKQLQTPLWFWNKEEWSGFTRAKEAAQRPLLTRALRDMRSDGQNNNYGQDTNLYLKGRIRSIIISLRSSLARQGHHKGWALGQLLEAIEEDISIFCNRYPEHQSSLSSLLSSVQRLRMSRRSSSGFYQPYAVTAVEPVIDEVQEFFHSIGGIEWQSGPDEDVPIPFHATEFADHVEALASQDKNPQYFDYLIMRIRMMLGNTRIRQVLADEKTVSLAEWLGSYIGANKAEDGSITVIDLSLVPTEIIHIVTAVIARMTLEALQRYRKLNEGRVLPTVLVMEEAHTFARRYKEDSENRNAAAICCQIFEKIAREGRKFGLGLVVSSQRPSELSPTVLSQCNTYLVHRISNDRDQDLISRLAPDHLRVLFRDLPSLSKRQAILLGWASEIPVLVQINYLPENQRPDSGDPDFWDVWTGKKDREVNWKRIADDWQQISGGEAE